MKILSICIATLNRAAYLRETLESIFRQDSTSLEVVIVDGASTDGTEAVVAAFQAQHPNLVYKRLEKNNGLDQDYSLSVELATGKYCWLMSDDDLLLEGAVPKVLAACAGGHSLIVGNVRVSSKDFSKVLVERRCPIAKDSQYRPSQINEFFADFAVLLSFIGCVVISRDEWLARNKETYFGTMFVHIGVIFQAKLRHDMFFISDPVVDIRYGNASWSGRGFEIWMFKWPQLLWSFPMLNEAAKIKVCPREPWRDFKRLCLLRALGVFTVKEYSTYISRLMPFGWRKLIVSQICRTPRGLLRTLARFYFTHIRPDPILIFDLDAS